MINLRKQRPYKKLREYQIVQQFFDFARLMTRRVSLADLRRDRALRYLEELPRNTPTVVSLNGQMYSAPDGHCFAHSFKEFFIRKTLDFESNVDSPFVLDCGANYGLFTSYIKTKYASARVIAFEPDPTAFSALNANCGSISDVTLLNAAVWDTSGTTQFVASGTDGGHLEKLTYSSSTNSVVNRTEVATVRLRDYLNEKVDFLKIDIEGAEFEVLADCADRLLNVDKMFVEVHSFIKKKQRLGEFFTSLENAGFRVHVHSSSRSARPFRKLEIHNRKDLRLNVFCWR